MLRENEQPEPCPPVELLLRHVVQPEGTDQQRQQVVDHLGRCPRCCEMFSALCDADEELWDEARRAADVPKPEDHPIRTVEEAFAETWRRIEEDEAFERRATIFRIGKFAAAMAACLALVLVGGWLMTGHFKVVSPASIVAPQGYAELVTDGAKRALTLGRTIKTQGHRQEVLLGGMHRVVMNQNSAATFHADNEGRYQVQLVQGELYVEVVPGNPFTVTTANARLDITGTKFDVKAEGDKTELTLLKGSVRFSALDHPQEAVSVAAGHASAVAGRATPTRPVAVDALATTAWAKKAILSNTVARIDPHVEVELSAISGDLWRQSAPADPDTLDSQAVEHQRKLAALVAGLLPVQMERGGKEQ